MALMLAGGASIMSILAGAGASVWLGPGGWIVASILLVAAGVALLWKLSDTELEQWFKQGPFGAENNYTELKQPDEALAVLLNMVFQPSLNIEANPFKQIALQRLQQEQASPLTAEQRALLHKVSQANTCIILNSELMGFADTDTLIHYGCRLYQYQEKRSEYKVITYERSYPPISHEVLHTEITPNGALIFTYTPQGRHPNGYLWLGAIQVTSDFNKSAAKTPRLFYHFPAPPFTEKGAYNPQQDSKLSLAMPATDSGIVTVSGGGELTSWAQRLKQPFWQKLLIDGNNIL